MIKWPVANYVSKENGFKRGTLLLCFHDCLLHMLTVPLWRWKECWDAYEVAYFQKTINFPFYEVNLFSFFHKSLKLYRYWTLYSPFYYMIGRENQIAWGTSILVLHILLCTRSPKSPHLDWKSKLYLQIKHSFESLDWSNAVTSFFVAFPVVFPVKSYGY